MKILSLSITHDASATILDNGKIVFYLSSERITRKKHCDRIVNVLKYLYEKKITKFDTILVNLYTKEDVKFEQPLKNLFDEHFKYKQLKFDYKHHHLYHAYCGFYNSKFNDALCVILDGHGAEVSKDNEFYTEIESIYYASQKEIKELWKKYTIRGKENQPESVGYKFEKLSKKLGFDWYGAGKVMGLAQYKGYEDKLESKWIPYVNECYQVQQETQNQVIELLHKYTKQVPTKNIVISGGYGLNCVANYEFLKHFPDHKFFIDPICFDAGISIGQAFYYHKQKSKFFPIKSLNNVYIGMKEDTYDLKGLNAQKVSYDNVAELLESGNMIALFQGRSEAGQRALGNRSLLFDPRVENGRDVVNKLKKRESFRPFAGTVLHEHANEWFDMRGLNDCSYMQHAVNAIKNGIPAMIHVDNTCRIQTLTKKQNKHFYNLISAFYKRTRVPMLLNTSFNLAGEPLVETFCDAINTMRKSDINYLYLPEIKTLVNFSKTPY
jgi:carbamoyltransferase